jgi:hypothetical protein
MEKKYDFLLFENHFWSFHHYIDLMNLAKMLDYAGYSVAIANYADETKYCINHKFPTIEIKHNQVRPHINSSSANRRNIFYSFIRRITLEYRQYRYAKDFLQQIDGLSSNIYAGSFSLELNFAFLLHFNPQVKVFFWGLRSYHLTNFLYHIKRNPFSGSKSVIFSIIFKRKEKPKFFRIE